MDTRFGGMIPGGMQAAQPPQDPRMGGMIPGGMSGGQAPATLGRGGAGFHPQRLPMQQPSARPPGLGGSFPGQSPGRQMPGQSQFAQRFSPHTSQNMAQPAALQQPQGGVRPGNNMMGGPSVGAPQGPSLEQIQSEMARRQVGGQLGPRNGALAGYMMG